MAQSYYSFYGSRLHLLLEDRVAEAYNRRTNQFFEAQQNFKEKHGFEWDPSKPFHIKADSEAQKAFEAVGKIINLLVHINGGGLDIPEEECTFDGLLKLEEA